MVNYTVPNNFTNIEEMYIEKIDLVSPDPSFSIPNPGKGADSIPCANANWLSTNCGSRGCTVWTRYCDYKWEACRWHNAGHGTISGVLQVTFSGEFISDIKISFGDHGNTGNSLRVDVYKNKPYAAEIAQTVTPTGKNKYWSGRTYEGSTWANPCQDFYGIFRPISCMYDTDRIPFGAISPPDPAVLPNPYDWDTDPNILGNQPIYYKFPDIDSTTLQPLPTPVRMGKWQNSSDVQRIFAQSYGIWSWSSNLCVGGDFDTNNCVNDLNCQSLCQQRCTDGVNIFPSSLCLVRDDCNYYGDEKCNLGTGTCIGPYIGSCTADQDCENGYCDNTSGFCNGGLNDSKACSSDTDCMLPNITCGPQSCANSTACISDSQCSGTCSVGGASRYFLNNTISNWTPPAGMADICPLPARAPADYCAYVPIVSNIKINGKNDYFPVTISGKVNLTFNSQVGSQQLPLIMYNIDWGDNTQTVMSGVEMRDKPNANLPHSLYHLYGYWELKSKRAVDQGLNNNNVYCGLNGGPVNNFNGVGNGNPCPVGQDCCLVQPKINIKDNWDWCSGQIDSTGAMAQTPNGKNDCSIYQKFGDETAVANDGWIVVTF